MLIHALRGDGAVDRAQLENHRADALRFRDAGDVVQ